MADQVLYSGVACITDLMVKEGLINLDFADVRSVMREMGKAMMGTGEASGEGRAMAAAEAAIANPLLDETTMRGAKGLLISITGGRDLTLFEVDEAATRIREEVDQDANIILGATFDEELEGVIRVSVVATGIDKTAAEIAAAPIAIRQPLKQAPRPAADARPAQAPAQQAPQMEVRSADPVAEAIRRGECRRHGGASGRDAGRLPSAEQAVPGTARRAGDAACPAAARHAAAAGDAACGGGPAPHAARGGLPARGKSRGGGQEPPGRP
jgi:cell division protein FtsZ